MEIKIIAALLLIGFFYLLSKAAIAIVGKDNSLSKAFPIGSTVLVTFLVGLMFLE